MRGQVNQPDYDQKVVLNSNNRFIYPSQQVPEYNVFNMYNDQYAATIFSIIEISWKWYRILISILYSLLKKDKTNWQVINWFILWLARSWIKSMNLYTWSQYKKCSLLLRSNLSTLWVSSLAALDCFFLEVFSSICAISKFCPSWKKLKWHLKETNDTSIHCYSIHIYSLSLSLTRISNDSMLTLNTSIVFFLSFSRVTWRSKASKWKCHSHVQHSHNFPPEILLAHTHHKLTRNYFSESFFWSTHVQLDNFSDQEEVFYTKYNKYAYAYLNYRSDICPYTNFYLNSPHRDHSLPFCKNLPSCYQNHQVFHQWLSKVGALSRIWTPFDSGFTF